MNPTIILIIITIVLVLIIYAIRYVLNNLINKGTDAIGNAYRKSKNVNKGPSVERLADIYPDIAAIHIRNGTATEASPALMQAVKTAGAEHSVAAGSVQSPVYAQQANVQSNKSYGQQANEQPSMGYGQQANKQPNAGYTQYQNMQYGSAYNKGANPTLAYIFIIAGLVINGILLLCFAVDLIRFPHTFSYNIGFEYTILFRRGTVEILLFISLIAVVANVVLLVTKKVIYTFFFPALMTVLNFLYMYVLNRQTHILSTRGLLMLFRSKMPPRDLMVRLCGLTFVVIAILFAVFAAIYLLKKYKWSLYILIGVGALLSIMGFFLLRVTFMSSIYYRFAFFNALGYPLVCLFADKAFGTENESIL